MSGAGGRLSLPIAFAVRIPATADEVSPGMAVHVPARLSHRLDLRPTRLQSRRRSGLETHQDLPFDLTPKQPLDRNQERSFLGRNQ